MRQGLVVGAPRTHTGKPHVEVWSYGYVSPVEPRQSPGVVEGSTFREGRNIRARVVDRGSWGPLLGPVGVGVAGVFLHGGRATVKGWSGRGRPTLDLCSRFR